MGSSSATPVTCTQTETILVPHHTLLRDGWEGQPNCVGQNLTWYWTIWQYMKVLGAQIAPGPPDICPGGSCTAEVAVA